MSAITLKAPMDTLPPATYVPPLKYDPVRPALSDYQQEPPVCRRPRPPRPKKLPFQEPAQFREPAELCASPNIPVGNASRPLPSKQVPSQTLPTFGEIERMVQQSGGTTAAIERHPANLNASKKQHISIADLQRERGRLLLEIRHLEEYAEHCWKSQMDVKIAYEQIKQGCQQTDEGLLAVRIGRSKVEKGLDQIRDSLDAYGYQMARSRKDFKQTLAMQHERERFHE